MGYDLQKPVSHRKKATAVVYSHYDPYSEDHRVEFYRFVVTWEAGDFASKPYTRQSMASLMCKKFALLHGLHLSKIEYVATPNAEFIL